MIRLTGSIKKEGEVNLSFQTLLFFFIPLGLSAGLVTISHVIINSTLARAPDPSVVIASYSVAMSIFGFMERCAVILRQTCSTLVRDKLSYLLMRNVAFYILTAIFLLNAVVAFTPVGKWIFSTLLGVSDDMLAPTMAAFQVLMFVTMFSGIRCLYQGVIISNFKTKWMTIGMVIRLVTMALFSWFLLANDLVQHGYIGAVIFLVGMAVEALVSFLEGRLIVKKLPNELEKHQVKSKKHIFRFYNPLMIASLIAVSVSPMINATLGFTSNAAVAIASFALAHSIVLLLVSITSYTHQVVINFYNRDANKVKQFIRFVAFIPTILLIFLTFTPIGIQILQQITGVAGVLKDQSITALRFFIIFTLCFPWIDYCNGLLMLRGQTKIMSFSQTGNVIITGVSLFILFQLFPSGGGFIGSLAQSIGFLIELTILSFFINTTLNNQMRKFHLITLRKLRHWKWRWR
ncbi:Na+-driven multidrug efflux pump [Gracilibacillus halotolerans]|uniref:Na+-driven multidrug efflux pump n=1 Tax=Gracilibacillus halotolerans TaxID=74386 RepID=A0A841RRE5_9BACI|nr:Na+-driven multidrug efflux pump [Gracilibacillus halotolerans]